MSWLEGFLDFKEGISVKEIDKEIYEESYNEGYPNAVQQRTELLNVSVFDTREEAEEYINNHNFWRKKNVGVRYKNYDSVKPSKKMLDLERRIAETEQKIISYGKAHSISTFKAEFVSCPNCKSKFKRDLLKNDYCPLCRTDMRSNTTLSTIKNYESKVKELKKQYKEEQKKLKEKATTNWLVSFQSYVG